MTDTICDECLAIDFGKLMKISQDDVTKEDPFKPQNDFDLLLEINANRFDTSSTENCALCRVLSASLCPCEQEWSDPGIVDYASQARYVLEAFSFRRNCPWVPGNIEGVQDCHMLLATRGAFASNRNYAKFVRGDGYVVCLPKEREERFYVPQVIPDTLNVAKARSWLENCKEAHDDRCNKRSSIVFGMKVIDCETLMVVDAQDGMDWVALSYVWGHAKPHPNSNSIQLGGPLIMLSRTVNDAIQVTRSLGYKYLWIDRYCIDQNDTASKRSQLERMDAIYHGAELTIIAAAGQDESHGLPGVRDTARKKQQIIELDTCTILSTGPDPIDETRKSRWWSRGWTFQEGIMSRRRLVFAEHQSFFECGGGCCMEALGGLELPGSPERLQYTSQSSKTLNSGFLERAQFRMARRRLPEATAGFDQFLTIARAYTKRTLTFDSDSLVAFAGVAHYLQRSEPKVSHLYGIPYMPSALDSGGDEGYIVYSLCWFHNGDSAPRRRAQFPSWTWAGWAGEVHWMTGMLTGTGKDVIPKLQSIQIEDNGQISAMEEYLRTFDPSNTTITGTDLALRFEAQVIPYTLFRLGESESEASACSSDEDSTHDVIESGTTSSVLAAALGDDQEHSENNIHLQDLHLQDQDLEGNCIASIQENDAINALGSYEDSNNSDNSSNTTTQSLDPHDWHDWVVGKHSLWDRSRMPEFDPLEFIQNIKSRRWSCLLLADYDANAGYSHRRFLLVVEWLKDGSAHRIGSIVLNQHHYIDADEPNFFEDKDLEWIKVRLI